MTGLGPGRVKITDFHWAGGELRSLMVVDLTIENTLSTPVRDLEIECRLAGNSRTIIDTSNQTLYEVIGAGETRTFENFNMGFINSQVEYSDCKVLRVIMG